MNLAHIRLIGAYASRYAIRGGAGLVFMLVAVTFGLGVSHIMLQPVESMVTKQVGEKGKRTEEAVEQAVDVAVNFARESGVVGWALGQEEIEEMDDSEAQMKAQRRLDAWTNHLLEDNPAVLSLILIVIMMGWPLIVACGAFDLYASDIANRGLRFQLLRTDRGSIFFGRFAGNFVTTAITLALLLSTVVLYIGLKIGIYDWGGLVVWGIQGLLLALIVLTLPYMALCAWVSATIASAFPSLIVGMLIIGGVPLVAWIAGMTHDSLSNLVYALPWGFQKFLLFHEITGVIGAVLGCLAFTALFLFLGYRQFRTRDL